MLKEQEHHLTYCNIACKYSENTDNKLVRNILLACLFCVLYCNKYVLQRDYWHCHTAARPEA